MIVNPQTKTNLENLCELKSETFQPDKKNKHAGEVPQ